MTETLEKQTENTAKYLIWYLPGFPVSWPIAISPVSGGFVGNVFEERLEKTHISLHINDGGSFLSPHLELSADPGYPVTAAPEHKKPGEDQADAGIQISLVCPIQSQGKHDGRYE